MPAQSLGEPAAAQTRFGTARTQRSAHPDLDALFNDEDRDRARLLDLVMSSLLASVKAETSYPTRHASLPNCNNDSHPGEATGTGRGALAEAQRPIPLFCRNEGPPCAAKRSTRSSFRRLQRPRGGHRTNCIAISFCMLQKDDPNILCQKPIGDLCKVDWADEPGRKNEAVMPRSMPSSGQRVITESPRWMSRH